MPLIAGGGASSASTSAQPAGAAVAVAAPLVWHRHRRAKVTTGHDAAVNLEEEEEEEGGRERCHLVQLALTPILSLPGARAYHSSVLVDGTEYWFSEAGVSIGRQKDAIASHSQCLEESEVITLGLSARTGKEMVAALKPLFRRGTYDMLTKNCNAWTDCCIWFLLRRRLDTGYVMLDRIAAGCPKLSKLLLKGDYRPNPRAANFDLELLIRRVTELYGHCEEETPDYKPNGFWNGASWFACMPGCAECVQQGIPIEKIVEPLPVLLGCGGHSVDSFRRQQELAPVNWQVHDACLELHKESGAPVSCEIVPRTSQITRPVEIISTSHVTKAHHAAHKARSHEKLPYCSAAVHRNLCSHELLQGKAEVPPAERVGQELMPASGATSSCDEAAPLSVSTRSALSRLAAKLSARGAQAAGGEERQAAVAAAVAVVRREGTSGSEGEDDMEEETSMGTEESSVPSRLHLWQQLRLSRVEFLDARCWCDKAFLRVLRQESRSRP